VKIVKFIGWIALISFVVIQFFPVDYNQNEVVPQTDFLLVNKVPAIVEKTLQVSCYDCHSNNTVYPWYNKIQPAAWFLEQHISDAKSELNFSEWDTYSDRKKKSKISSIIKQIESGEMPMESYTILHRAAKLDSVLKGQIINYMKTL
tara:strand:+ start:2713 stop:3153 length:441 start_codon:yes stop_codon:yes gene_type:complete